MTRFPLRQPSPRRRNFFSAAAVQNIYAHPLESKSNSNVVEFEVHFAKAGTYKTWGQFQRDGKVFTIPTVVEFMDDIRQQ
jgi:hypothetical protein